MEPTLHFDRAEYAARIARPGGRWTRGGWSF